MCYCCGLAHDRGDALVCLSEMVMPDLMATLDLGHAMNGCGCSGYGVELVPWLCPANRLTKAVEPPTKLELNAKWI